MCCDDKNSILAWEWFKYHASQRMHSFHFFLLLLIAFGSGIIMLDGDSNNNLVEIVSALGIICSVVFWLLDVRNEELVNIGRKALKNDLNKANSNDPILESLNGSLKRDQLIGSKDFASYIIPGLFIRHRFLFRLVFFSSACAFIVVLVDRRDILRPHLLCCLFVFVIFCLSFALYDLVNSDSTKNQEKQENQQSS